MLKLAIPLCPTCHEPVIGILQAASGPCGISSIKVPDERGLTDWCGSTEYWEDAVGNHTDKEGLWALTCGEHQWFSKVEEG